LIEIINLIEWSFTYGILLLILIGFVYFIIIYFYNIIKIKNLVIGNTYLWSGISYDYTGKSFIASEEKLVILVKIKDNKICIVKDNFNKYITYPLELENKLNYRKLK